MAKLNIVKHFKIEKDGIYVIKLTHEPTIEVMRAIQQQFEQIYKDTGARFIIIGKQMDLCEATELFEHELFVKRLTQFMIDKFYT